MSREEFEQEDDQYHAMMMKYHWKHFWGTFEAKAKAIFGEGKEQKNNYAEPRIVTGKQIGRAHV